MERSILTAIDQLIYARQSEWSRWSGLVIDRHKLRNLILDAVMHEIEKAFPVDPRDAKETTDG
jgi:hypothetical protein